MRIQNFSIPGALCKDGHSASIRALIRLSVVYLFLALGFFAVDGQFPRACTTEYALHNKICCPLLNGSPCGEDAGRGVCSNKYLSSYSQVSENPYEDNECLDDRLYWPTRHYKHYCICKGNYTGYSCGECKYGYCGEKCQEKRTLVRKEIRNLTDTEREKFLRYLNLAKSTTSRDYVILVCSDRNDPKSFQFRNASIYDVFAWIHHYATKSINLNCTHTVRRNFAHRGPAFLTWHRMILLGFEENIQRLTADCNFALPYYDWSQETNCSICCDEYLGRNDLDGNIVNSTYFSSWGAICSNSIFPNSYCDSAATDTYSDNLHRNPGREDNSGMPTYQDVVNVINWKDYDAAPYDEDAICCFRNALEGFVSPIDGKTYGNYLHNRIHMYFVGTMSDVSISANDPMFFLHHNYVDYMFECWIRQHNASPDSYPENSLLGQGPFEYIVPFCPELMNRDLLQRSTGLGYTFDQFKQYE